MSEQHAILDHLTTKASPSLRQGYCIGTDCSAELLVTLGDNPERFLSEAVFAKLCGTAPPLPMSSGIADCRRLSRGGDRRANAALHRIVVRMHHDERTKLYVARGKVEGITKRDIIRCLKHAVTREVFSQFMADYSPVPIAHAV